MPGIRISVDASQAAQAARTTDRAFDQIGRGARDMEREISRTQRTINGLTAGLGRATRALTSWQSVLTLAAGATGLAYFTKSMLNATAEIQRNANMAGISIEAYQELSYAAKQHGVTQGAITDGIKEMTLRFEEFAKTGSGPGKEALETLGFKQENINELLKDTPGLLQEVIRRMEGLEQASKLRLQDEIFGGQGGEQFTSLVNAGADALKNMAEEAHKLGMVISDDLIENSVVAKRKIDVLTDVVSIQFQSAVATLAPEIAKVAGFMTDWVGENQDFLTQDVPDHMEDIAIAASWVLDSVHGVGRVFGVAGRMAAVMALEVEHDMYQLADAIWNGPANALNAVIQMYNAIPMLPDIDFNFAKFGTGLDIENHLEMLKHAIEEGMDDIEKTLMQPFPGRQIRERINEFSGDVKQSIDITGEAAQNAANNNKDLSKLNLTDKEFRMSFIDQDSIDATKAKLKEMEDEIVDWMNYDKLNLTDKERRMMFIDDDAVAATKDKLQEMENAGVETADTWKDAFAGWASGFSGTLNEMLWGAETTFQEIATSFAKMVTQMIIQKQIVEPLVSGVGSFMGGIFTSGSGNVVSGIEAYSNQIVTQPTFVPGVGKVGAYATGGAIFGEAGPEAIMPLTRMSSGNLGVETKSEAPNIEINVINNGEPADAKTTAPKWDGEKYVIGVVLDAMNRNKSGFRTSMKGMVTA